MAFDGAPEAGGEMPGGMSTLLVRTDPGICSSYAEPRREEARQAVAEAERKLAKARAGR